MVKVLLDSDHLLVKQYILLNSQVQISKLLKKNTLIKHVVWQKLKFSKKQIKTA